jgi:DNA repair exonuclease SbcCD ATPase subunit
MITIKNVTMKNFLSVGSVTQSVILDKPGTTLVLGENLDLGGDGARNGVGKSTLLSAISYGLYGIALTNIKRDNLINFINKKGLVVSVEFEKDGHKYRIERGRKPNFFKFFVDDAHVNNEDTDEAQGESRETQAEINKVLGMSHDLFRHLVALNTYTEPFLSMGSGKQRVIIEELLGITLLSQKAANLKELINTTKIAIDQEELVIRLVKQSNDRVHNTLLEFEKNSQQWQTKHSKTISDLEVSIGNLSTLDIDQELARHEELAAWSELDQVHTQLNRDIAARERAIRQYQTQLDNHIKNYQTAASQSCPMCDQAIAGHQHQQIMTDLETQIAAVDQSLNSERQELSELTQQLELINNEIQSEVRPQVYYPNIKQALNHKNTIQQLHKDLERETNTENPYTDQSQLLSKSIQEVSYDKINVLVKQREHQEFLYKLLTNKDSFIRKRIIDQNLVYLNNRLAEYLDKLGLPHRVTFLNDLSVEINILGQDLDFDSLSRGERTRLILGLSWAFRDIFESTVGATNLLFIDELLDQGIDTAGLESSIEILKKMERERKKNIFVISHREELITRMTQTLTVIKEDGYSRFEWDYVPNV